MSPSASLHASSPYQSRNGSTTTLHTLNNVDPATTTRSGRIAALARLRIPSASPRREKIVSPLERAKKEFTMSMCSEATTVEERPPLPTSASELTLAHSISSAKDETRSLAKTLVHRSSRMFLKRKTSKASIASSWAADSPIGSDDHSRRGSIDSTTSTRPGSRHGRAKSKTRHQAGPSPPLPSKPLISGPFNFQHVAHTAPLQAITALRQVSPSALEVEFSAMQAGQTPSHQLKHIEVDKLRPTTADGTSSPVGSISISPLERPVLRRNPTSVDSFKRQSRSFSQPFFQGPGPTPPPRKSSRKRPPYLERLATQGDAVQESPTVPDFMHNTARPKTAPSPRSPLRVATSAASTPLGLTGIHAVTTPDDTACMLMPDVTTPLEDVPEEEDLYMADIANKASAGKSSSDSAQNRMIRSGSDPVLPESAMKDAEEIPSRASHRVSKNVLSLRNWEDEIDYCYNNALEAESTPASPDVDSPVSEVDELVYMNLNHHRRQGSQASKASIEEVSLPMQPLHLRRPSAQAQAPKKMLRPPSMLNAPIDSAGNVMFTLSPSMLVPHEYMAEETMTIYHPHHSRQSSTKSTISSSSNPLAISTPSVSDLSHAYSSPRTSVTFSSSSKRNSTLAVDSTSNLSTVSIPDVVPSTPTGQLQKRKSFGSRSTRSSVYSQGPKSSESEQFPPTPVPIPEFPQPPHHQQLPQQQQHDETHELPEKKAEEEADAPAPDEVKEAGDTVSEMPSSAAQQQQQQQQQQPLRARAKSDSASRALAQSNHSASKAGVTHGRSASSAATATATGLPRKATYSLFPPLDRIGATPARA